MEKEFKSWIGKEIPRRNKMTDIDYYGRRLNKATEINCTYKDWNEITEEVLCEIINKGLVKTKRDIEAFGRIFKLIQKLKKTKK